MSSKKQTHRLTSCSQKPRCLLVKGRQLVAPKLAAAIGDDAISEIAASRQELQPGAHSWAIHPHTGAGQQLSLIHI